MMNEGSGPGTTTIVLGTTAIVPGATAKRHRSIQHDKGTEYHSLRPALYTERRPAGEGVEFLGQPGATRRAHRPVKMAQPEPNHP